MRALVSHKQHRRCHREEQRSSGHKQHRPGSDGRKALRVPRDKSSGGEIFCVMPPGFGVRRPCENSFYLNVPQHTACTGIIGLFILCNKKLGRSHVPDMKNILVEMEENI